MAKADSVLITGRRNFLVRALGFTAAGAALSIPIVTVADAKTRVEHHTKALQDALSDLYPGLSINAHTDLQPAHVVSAGHARGYIMLVASPHPIISGWKENDAFQAKLSSQTGRT